MTVILVYSLLTASMYYLGAHALITQPIWSRYPRGFDKFMLCAACSGAWYGVLVAGFGGWARISFLGLDPRHFTTAIVIGLCSTVWTPIMANVLLRSLSEIPSTISEEPHAQEDRDTSGAEGSSISETAD